MDKSDNANEQTSQSDSKSFVSRRTAIKAGLVAVFVGLNAVVLLRGKRRLRFVDFELPGPLVLGKYYVPQIPANELVKVDDVCIREAGALQVQIKFEFVGPLRPNYPLKLTVSLIDKTGRTIVRESQMCGDVRALPSRGNYKDSIQLPFNSAVFMFWDLAGSEKNEYSVAIRFEEAL